MHVSLRWKIAIWAGVFAVHYICFYWWVADAFYFSGDGLYYFSRRIDTISELITRFLSVDEMYQYRPLTYVFFSFVLFPLFDKSPAPYHAAAYAVSAINAVLACGCIYYWTSRSKPVAWFAIILLLINPVHFFPSFGPTFIDQWLSSFFYFLTLLIVVKDSRHAWIPASICFLLALLSKEHSVTLPAHAVLMLWTMGMTFRDALRKTRNLWIVLTVFMAFQLSIRYGNLFAPPGRNPNMAFNLSPMRAVDLARGAKAAIFYPENYSMDSVLPGGRFLRMLALLLIAGLVLVALRRNRMLALASVAWVLISLAPIAFAQVQPDPRHYYLGLPGVAVLFAIAIGSWRTMAFAFPLFVLATVTNIDLYGKQSWVVAGSRSTQSYIRNIQSMRDETGRSKFYVTRGQDPHFFFNIDGGAAVPEMIDRDVSFGFGFLQEPISTDSWLANTVNIIVPEGGHVRNAFSSGIFPPLADADVCGLIHRFSEAGAPCALLFRGQPVIASLMHVVETPNGLPVFPVSDATVTLSRTTIRFRSMNGWSVNRMVRLAPESEDGVIVRIFHERAWHFEMVLEQKVAPGERVRIQHFAPADQSDHVVIRIHPGQAENESGDWLIWEPDEVASGLAAANSPLLP